MSQTALKLDILIIGGGIGGLAAAIPLARAGHNVTVFESRPELTQIGGAIAISPNGVRVLAAWGLEEKLRPFAQLDMGFEMRRWQDDSLIAQGRHGKKETSGFAQYDLKRAILQNILYEGAVEAGARIEFGKKVSDLDIASGQVTFCDGLESRGDLIIGADGVNSSVRKSMFPDQEIAHAHSSSDCFYLVELLEISLRSNPALTSILNRPFMGAWLGPSQVIIVNTVGRDFISHAVVSAHGQGEVGEWDDRIALEALQQEFSDFGPVARGILAAGKGCYKWKIAEVGPLPKWFLGKAVLLGDAAHAMYPTRGQGATMGLEDAACLGECINAAKSHELVARVLQIYEGVRKPRVEAIAASSKKNFEIFTMPDGHGQQVRDQRMREAERKAKEAALPSPLETSLKGHDVPEAGPAFEVWILRYDAIKETREVLQAL